MSDIFGQYRAMRPVEPIPVRAMELLHPSAWTSPAKAREWIIQDWVPRGVVTALYGDGGMGKSLLAQQLMTSVSFGLPWLGLEVAKGRALGIMCEDDPDELHRRQEAINASISKPMVSIDGMAYVSRVGDDNVLMAFDGADVGELTHTYYQIEKTCEEFRPDLVVMDTIADFFGGNENNRSQVRQFVQNTFGRLARKFNCGLVICGHPSASGISSGSGTGGSTAWNNTVRSRMYLTTPDGDDVNPDARLLSRKKANYAARDASLTLVWQAGAFVVAEPGQTNGLPAWDIISDLLDMIDAGWRSGRPWSLAPQTRAGGRYLPQAAAARIDGLSATAVQRLVSDWLAEGHLTNEAADPHTKMTGLKVLRRFDRTR